MKPCPKGFFIHWRFYHEQISFSTDIVASTVRSCFEFLQKVFLVLIRQIARYLPHHRSENASKTHPKSSHDKFKTASKVALEGLICIGKSKHKKRESSQIPNLH